MSAPPVTLVFDGHCGFCTRSVQWIERLDRGETRCLAPCQAPGVLDAHGLSRADCEAAAWAFGADGTRHRGAAAVNAALGAALRSRLPLAVYRAPGIRSVQDAAYAWVARNRRRFRGVEPWCRQHPEAGCEADRMACTL